VPLEIKQKFRVSSLELIGAGSGFVCLAHVSEVKN
jgi:hypothetical protein